MMAVIVTCVAAGALLAALLLFRSKWERTHIQTDVYEISTEKLGADWDGYTMVVLADLHDNQFGKDNCELLTAIEAAHPDVILIAGDMITEHHGKKPLKLEPLGHFLRELTKRYPVYYGDGNHEQRQENREKFDAWLAQTGVIHLQNASAYLKGKPGMGDLRVTGMHLPKQYYLKKGRKLPMRSGELEQRLGAADREAFQILLAHCPLYAEEYAAWGADLSISGHFHGGTIRLPKVGGLMTPQFQFFYPYTRGIYKMPDGSAYAAVSAGLGTHSIDIRLNNVSQLLVVRLRVSQETDKDRQD